MTAQLTFDALLTAPRPTQAEAERMVADLEQAERDFGAATDPADCVAAAARCTALRARLVAAGVQRRTWRWDRGAPAPVEDRPTRVGTPPSAAGRG